MEIHETKDSKTQTDEEIERKKQTQRALVKPKKGERVGTQFVLIFPPSGPFFSFSFLRRALWSRIT